jgi:hypothetical protein
MTNHPNRNTRTMKFVRFENEKSPRRGSNNYHCDHIIEYGGKTYRVHVSGYQTAHCIADAERILKAWLAGAPEGSPLSHAVQQIS